MRPKSLILIVIALGCGLVASIGISQVMEGRSANANSPKIQTAKILVANMEINTGEVIDAQMVRLEEWPKSTVPDGAITRLEDIDGARPRQRIFTGEPILEAKLIATGEMAEDASLRLREGYRAVSVKVSSDQSVTGLIRPGDRVDVLAYLRKSADIPQTMTKTVLETARVFAVNDKLDRSIDDDGKGIKVSTVTLEVKPQDVERLMLANQLGKILLSVRRPDDESRRDSRGAIAESLLHNSNETTVKEAKPKDEVSDWLAQMKKIEEDRLQSLPPEHDTIDIITPNGWQRFEFVGEGRPPREVAVDDLAFAEDEDGSSGDSDPDPSLNRTNDE